MLLKGYQKAPYMDISEVLPIEDNWDLCFPNFVMCERNDIIFIVMDARAKRKQGKICMCNVQNSNK